MTDLTRFNMTAPKWVAALKKNGFAVADEKTGNGFEISKNGDVFGWLDMLRNGTPFIRSAKKTEIYNGTRINKHYYTVSGFIKYGT